MINDSGILDLVQLRLGQAFKELPIQSNVTIGCRRLCGLDPSPQGLGFVPHYRQHDL
jgi:hypothetical protein